MNHMTTHYRLTSRGSQGGTLYCVDKTTNKRTSLKTTDHDEAEQIIAAKNHKGVLTNDVFYSFGTSVASVASGSNSSSVWWPVIRALLEFEASTNTIEENECCLAPENNFHRLRLGLSAARALSRRERLAGWRAAARRDGWHLAAHAGCRQSAGREQFS
jgi:hypothetical protein